jgi:hypothetical protein
VEIDGERRDGFDRQELASKLMRSTVVDLGRMYMLGLGYQYAARLGRVSNSGESTGIVLGHDLSIV